MGLQRLYFGSNVLPDGRVFVQGGEYSGPFGCATTPTRARSTTRSPTPGSTIATFPQVELRRRPHRGAAQRHGPGRLHLRRRRRTSTTRPTNTWTAARDQAPQRPERRGGLGQAAGRQHPVLRHLLQHQHRASATPSGTSPRPTPGWMPASVPVQLSSAAVGYELGPGFLLPDGRVFYLGANGNTAYYTESTNSWTAGPVIPSGLGADDAPGADAAQRQDPLHRRHAAVQRPGAHLRVRPDHAAPTPT